MKFLPLFAIAAMAQSLVEMPRIGCATDSLSRPFTLYGIRGLFAARAAGDDRVNWSACTAGFQVVSSSLGVERINGEGRAVIAPGGRLIGISREHVFLYWPEQASILEIGERRERLIPIQEEEPVAAASSSSLVVLGSLHRGIRLRAGFLWPNRLSLGLSDSSVLLFMGPGRDPEAVPFSSGVTDIQPLSEQWALVRTERSSYAVTLREDRLDVFELPEPQP